MSGQLTRKLRNQSPLSLYSNRTFVPNSSVELAVWTHSLACDIKPELLENMPENDVVGTNGTTNSHTTIESITGDAKIEQSGDDESSSEVTPPAEEPTEAVEAVKKDEKEVKPDKPANGELARLSQRTAA